MLITEKILGDLGGWQAMKTARALVAAGAVESAERAGDRFQGLVREGRRRFAASLVVEGPGRAAGRCSCGDAQSGRICAHALAAALQCLGATPARSESSTPPARAHGKPPAPQRGPKGRFDVFIPPGRIANLTANRGRLPVFLRFQPGDAETDSVASWLAAQNLPLQGGPLSLEEADLDSFLLALRDHPTVWEGSPAEGADSCHPVRIGGNLGDWVELHARIGPQRSVAFSLARRGAATDAASRWRAIPLAGRTWIWLPDARVLTPLDESSPELHALLAECLDRREGESRRDLRWLASRLEALEQLLPLETDAALARLRLEPAEPRFAVELDGSPRRITLRLEARVGESTHPVSSISPDAGNELYPIAAAGGGLTFLLRNSDRENRLRSELERAGFKPEATGGWALEGDRPIGAFFGGLLPRLERAHEVAFSSRWREAFGGWSRIAPVVRAPVPGAAQPAEMPHREGRGWLDMEFSYEAPDGFRVSRHDLLRLLRSGQAATKGRHGRTYILDAESCEDFEALLSESEARLGEGNRLLMDPGSAYLLEEFAAPGQDLPKPVLPEPEEVRRRLGALSETLRPYQFEGVRWLIASTSAKRGALLADDMGLGKTLQVIALLKWLESGEQPAGCSQEFTRSALVVCPTSLISNWKAEIERFAWSFCLNIYHGIDRVIHTPVNNFLSVTITTYALIVKDLEHHRRANYDAIVLDEASYLRNPDTAVAQAIPVLRSPIRVALTGTPVENSIRDLWSIMRFLQPGLLGDRRDFEARYVKPLARDPAAPEQRPLWRRLRARLGPFVLRRTKKEVAREIPDKIEKTIYCELSNPQKEAYRRLLEEGLAEIREMRRRSAGAARMTMFTVLLRLRQACNDLRLLGLKPAAAKGEQESDGTEECGKWPALADILDEALGGGHKVLLFSQFTGMLGLLKGWLEDRGIDHSYLDGSTRDRAGQVAAFQGDPAKRVFLISLKAGGYGLNLTAADHVVLLEPWWNPAVEAQAIDRAHRIGQANPVTASRLIARGTVEERILRLQNSKRELMNAAVEDNPMVLPGLTDAELEGLLEALPSR